MKKLFSRITFLICIGIVFSAGFILVSAGAGSVQNPAVFAEGGSEDGYTVNINTGDINLLSESLIRTRVISSETDSVPAEYLGVQNLNGIKEGTVINITVKSDTMFEFVEFSHNADASDILDEKDGSASELRFVVNADITVKAVFSEIPFDAALIISGLEGVEDVPLGDSVRVSVDGDEKNYKDYAETGMPIEPGQTLDYIAFDGMVGYSFDDILIKPKGSDYQSFRLNPLADNKDSQDKIEIDGDSVTYNYDRFLDAIFFDEFLSVNSELLLEINLIRLCKLSFFTSADMGRPVVDEYVGVDALGGDVWQKDVGADKYFTVGTKLRVTAVPEDFHTFNGFDRLDLTATGSTYEFSIYDNRTINLNFTANTYQIDSNLSITASKSNFRVGETVIFTYDVPVNYDITGWELFNSDKTVKFGEDEVKRNGNSVAVTLTGEMLAEGKFALKHEVVASMKTGVLIGIIVPSVILPLLIILLAVFVITDQKRKRFIKTTLEGKWAEMKTKDVSGYISALREGQDGTVSKEDIKKAMKEQKEG